MESTYLDHQQFVLAVCLLTTTYSDDTSRRRSLSQDAEIQDSAQTADFSDCRFSDPSKSTQVKPSRVAMSSSQDK